MNQEDKEKLFNNYLEAIEDYKLLSSEIRKCFKGISPEEIMNFSNFSGYVKCQANLSITLDNMIKALEENDLELFIKLESENYDLVKLLMNTH